MSETFRKEVTALLDAFFTERPDLFLMELSVGADLSIKVVVDGDSGVNVNDCVEVSRAIEHNLDKEKYDFSLDVLSAGASAPLKLLRQYPQHVGRTLKVETAEGSFKGKFTEISDQMITLKWEERQSKAIGKGKVTVECEQKIEFDQIIKTEIEITF
jgi:ribosome maturation factor RimP